MDATWRWRKSSRSEAGANNCVELAQTADAAAVRDSKNPAGPILIFGRAELASFLETIKAGRFPN